jgi:pheromone shutdown-related protein TraB
MITLIGTAHISQESIREVRERILEIRPDLVAVELDEARYRGMLQEQDVPLFDLIRKENSLFLLANILLSYLQRRMGKQVGAKPGEEMLTAVQTAEELGIPFALIDRDIKITMKRALAQMPLGEKVGVVKELFQTFALGGEEIEEEIEGLKGMDKMEEILESFREIAPNLYRVLVDERDIYMASQLSLLEARYPRIVAVVGAGHREGIEARLERGEPCDLSPLLEVPRKRFGVGKALKFGIPLLFLGVFLLAFSKGIALDQPIQQWILYHSLPTFFAVLIAGGSLIAALVGMVAAPLTAINPLLAAGWFAGLAELKVRGATVGDATALFHSESFRELYRNRAFKVLLVTAFANLGSSLGTLVSFPRVLLPLLRGVLGG